MTVRGALRKLWRVARTRGVRRRPFAYAGLAWKTWTGAEVPKHGPVHLHVEPTTRCNLRCSMCEHTFWKEKNLDLSLEGFRRLLDRLPDVASVDLTGIGEALLSEHFPALLEEAKRRGFRVRFNDNGTLLDGIWSRKLVELGVDEVHVSMDGATPDTFEKTRKGASLERVLGNLKELIRIRAEARSVRPEIHFICIAMKEILPELPALVDLAADVGVGHVDVQGLVEFGENRDHAVDAREADTEKWFAVARRRATARGVVLSLPSVRPKTTRCHLPWFQTYILVDGTVLPCCLYGQRNNREELRSALSFGNIFETPWAEIWGNEQYRKIRRELASGELTGICAVCPVPRGQF